jgi:ferritin-like metal-binding protein YciE
VDTRCLRALFEQSVRELHSAATQILVILPELIENADDEDLRDALSEHYLLTQEKRRRLEHLAPDLGIELGGVPCYGMSGIVREEIEAVHRVKRGAPRDATIAAHAQKVEHYEIASYAVAAQFAEVLGELEAALVLDRSVAEAMAADRRLAEISLMRARDALGRDDSADALARSDRWERR